MSRHTEYADFRDLPIPGSSWEKEYRERIPNIIDLSTIEVAIGSIYEYRGISIDLDIRMKIYYGRFACCVITRLHLMERNINWPIFRDVLYRKWNGLWMKIER